MNPGLILIIRNTFPFHLLHFILSAIYYFENTKILSLLAITHKTPKNNSTILHIIYFALLDFIYFIYFSLIYLYFILLIRNLVLDNHLVELWTQDELFYF